MDVLAALEPVGSDYATRPVAEAFTWVDAAGDLPPGEYYLVAFRSIRRPGADEARLIAYDEAANLEAAAAPGFVHYVKGPAARDGTCLSFCLWSGRAEARAAAGLPAHREAVSLLNEMYAAYTLEFLRVTRSEPGGPIRFAPYDPLPPGADPGRATMALPHTTLAPHPTA